MQDWGGTDAKEVGGSNERYLGWGRGSSGMSGGGEGWVEFLFQLKTLVSIIV